ncbi:hypothetical protein GALL_333780 [mine drainage metagenome]|uniref:DUF3426 domain-containing protein n=1 Tax=mine drainage metagenome TaxID=410659 RepID=A0A1J5QMQ2_9ZZZZ
MAALDAETADEPLLGEANFDLGDTLHFQFDGGAPTEPPRELLPPPREPEFVRRARAAERWRQPWRRALLSAMLVLGVATLTLQAAWTWRDTLAAQWSGSRGMLQLLCKAAGCTLQAPRRPQDLVLEASSMAPAADGKLLLDASLHNRGELAVAYPALELTLDGDGERTLVRKVLLPADYLPAGTAAADGLAAGADLQLHLRLKLAQGQASGYQLYAFYP